ncbi:C4-dicarboxylate ABC transporter permease [Sulfitobacter sp. M57]|uniref:TRAP transporter small permease subunit n=1 Tax=unclassified Sulfitobacter TaxID=196795 RepID=UPI0023E14E98|nr:MULTISPECIES: C4-dicarboxylate ABC transporter permease [unclassified Sulfitobacter]MDF3413549.1 C4-dicarboxylate ABC transporter permease [Sulfitobacter sp. KE5]MDF3421169.1 C4-dicarboxylate ABC transporter permease [Sulfitobacter sp. KE43]MDF3432096.1 C4-dicarboxylate ABC transporter permease [Sulfitobacter sp. KE42]MDF3457736.1 C4-dicarboxylate ABC transporter permease [Sulfitobacter sp. S74]MDF3461637.1 C4-dicarboxylate ABC transporter permease [Sulfitobacter sp. Ks18]
MAEDVVCSGFFRAAEGAKLSCLDKFQDSGGVQFILGNLVEAPYNLFAAILQPTLWLNWSDPQAMMRFIYYGASTELFFVLLLALLILTGVAMRRRELMWSIVRGLEWLGNGVGRLFAWAGLIMVLQQIIIVFMQRIFTRPDISIGFGIPLQFDISWFAEELKLFNALVVCLCVSYTFVQGGHVRVDLFYAGAKFRTKKIVDMFGALFFMIPFAVVTWLYGWFFMWRHLVTPNPSASDRLELLLRKARVLKWNVETIGFSPNGFNGYFIFKILLCLFCAMVILQAIAVFYRSWCEFKEGPDSEGKYLDKDTLGEGEEAYEGTH